MRLGGLCRRLMSSRPALVSSLAGFLDGPSLSHSRPRFIAEGGLSSRGASAGVGSGDGAVVTLLAMLGKA